MGSFCSTSFNPVSQSLKADLPELSSQVNNLHDDIYGHQNTRMDFLCSNFVQINDSFVIVKNDVARTTTISDMQFFFQVLIKV